MSFLIKFGPKIQTFLFKVKFSSYDHFHILRLFGILPSFWYYFDAQLLLTNMAYTSCLTSKNDLRLRILEN